jgi:hypothetical protein
MGLMMASSLFYEVIISRPGPSRWLPGLDQDHDGNKDTLLEDGQGTRHGLTG